MKSDNGLMLLDSLAMRLQVMGESIKVIQTKFANLEEKYPSIEWKKIIKFRDILSHHYDVVNHEIVYDICINHLGSIKDIFQKLKNTL